MAVLKLIFSLIITIFIFLGITPKTTQAQETPIALDQSNITFPSITFTATGSPQFNIDPSITIYIGHNCDSASRTYISDAHMTTSSNNRSFATYIWTTGLDRQNYSAKARRNDFTVPTFSTCINGTTPPVPPIPVPQPDASPNDCPTLISVQPENPTAGIRIEYKFNPPINRNDINNYSLIVVSAAVQGTLSEVGGNWIGTFSGLPEGTHRVEISIVNLGSTCAVDNILTVLPAVNDGGGLPSGANPCIDTDGDGKVDECPTALGSIPTNITGFAGKFLTIAISLAGGIALILLVYGSIRVLMSSGDPKNVGAGREVIIGAVAGLLFLIFSVLILRALGLIIGVPF